MYKVSVEKVATLKIFSVQKYLNFFWIFCTITLLHTSSYNLRSLSDNYCFKESHVLTFKHAAIIDIYRSREWSKSIVPPIKVELSFSNFKVLVRAAFDNGT